VTGLHPTAAGLHAPEAAVHGIGTGLHAAESGRQTIKPGLHTIEFVTQEMPRFSVEAGADAVTEPGGLAAPRPAKNQEPRNFLPRMVFGYTPLIR
jgi:hypothetical protein